MNTPDDYGYEDAAARNTFENLDAREGATFDIAEESAPVGPLGAIGWLTFVILLVCSPAICAAVWMALL